MSKFAMRKFEEPKVGDIDICRNKDGSFSLMGELSCDNVTILSRKAAPLFEQEIDLQIDLGGITHSDSAGVALLVEWLSEARHRHQDIQFINIPAQMLDVVRISSLDRVLPIS